MNIRSFAVLASLIAGSIGIPGAAAAETPAFRAVHAFTEGTCAITREDVVWCWGFNGSLGLKSWAPTPLAPSMRFDAVTGDYKNMCMLGTDGAIYCAGEGAFGVRENAYGTADVMRKPARLNRAPEVAALRFRDVSSTGVAVCAVAEAGSIWCWGKNEHGVFGNGAISEQQALADIPSRVQSDVPFVDVEVSRHFACALTGEGLAWCWGSNEYGQLGDGTKTDRLVPGPVEGGHRFRSISVGGSNACGLTVEGDMLCWGRDFLLGRGFPSAQIRLTPSIVAPGTKWTAVEVNSLKACAVSVERLVYCWGEGSEGVLGTGEIGEPGIADRYYVRAEAPQAIVGGHRFTDVAVGYDHACALEADGVLWCWGGNQALQLGAPKGSVTMTGTPRRVVLP